MITEAVEVRTFDRYRYEMVDWDPEEAEGSNLAHCLTHGVDETVVYEVVYEGMPVQVSSPLTTADFVIVGPNAAWTQMYTLLLADSWKRGDWLRPVTGWLAKLSEVRKWEAATRLKWGGRSG